MMAYYTHENIDHPIRGQNSAPEILLSDLDFFSGVAIQKDIEASYHQEVFPNPGTLDQSQQEVIFETKPSIDLISLVDSYIEILVNIQKKQGNSSVNPTAQEKVNVSNNVLFNLWQDMRLEVNNKEVHTSNQLFYLEAYIILLLSLSSDSLAKWETAGKFSM